MSAQPIHDHDPEDPVEILRVLPARYHQQFRAEYQAAAHAAQQMEGDQGLQRLLRLWRLRAATYSDPGYEQARTAVQTAHPDSGTPIEDLFPGWAERLHGR